MASYYNTVNLPPHLAQAAAEKLNETPENRQKGLDGIRQLMFQNPKPYMRDDDAFLLAFLRCKKFRVDDAFQMLKNFTDYMEENKSLMVGVDHNKLRPIYEQGFTRLLPGTDRQGRRISVLLPSKMNLGENFDVLDMLRFNMLLMQHVLWDPEMQVNGMVIVENFDGFKLMEAMRMQSKMDSKIMKKMMKMMQDTMPVRLQGIWIMNQPSYISILWAMVRPFMKKKMRKRVVMMGNDIAQLEALVDFSQLPPEFGGNLSEHPMAYWDVLSSGRPVSEYFQPTSA